MVSKDKTTVTFHSGVLTIGGTVIEVAYQDSHIFFDFGTEFHPEESIPNEHLQTLIDYRHIPHLKNVYDPRLPYKYEGSEDEVYQNTAIFISHVHLDHTKMLNLSDPKVPVYTANATKVLLQLLNKAGNFLIKNPEEAPDFTRDIIGVEPHTTITVGEISVTLLPVDHDAYGACGFIIETPTAKLAYTGDLRLHGFFKEDTLNYCKKAFHCDALMIEGVSVSWPEENKTRSKKKNSFSSETALLHQMKELLLSHPKTPAVFNGYPGNVQRFVKIAEEMPRQVVLSATMAKVIKTLQGKDVHYYYLPHEKPVKGLDQSFEIPYDNLLKAPFHYFWQVQKNFENLPAGTLYIHSDAEPLGDFDPKYQPFIQQLEKQGIRFIPMSCSGHAVPDDLKNIITAIEPKLLIPIHTLHPEVLENPYGERILPVRGQKIHF